MRGGEVASRLPHKQEIASASLAPAIMAYFMVLALIVIVIADYISEKRHNG